MSSIHVPVQEYRGSDKKKKIQYIEKLSLAKGIEDYLDFRFSQHEKGPLVIMFHEVARALNEPLEKVSKLGTAIQGSSSGVTLYK